MEGGRVRVVDGSRGGGELRGSNKQKAEKQGHRAA